MGQHMGVRQEEVCPQCHPLHPLHGDKGRDREIVRCSLQASANRKAFGGGWGRGSIGLAPDYQLERDELLLRKEAALQL